MIPYKLLLLNIKSDLSILIMETKHCIRKKEGKLWNQKSLALITEKLEQLINKGKFGTY